MKTIIQYLLFVVVLTFSQFQVSWAGGDFSPQSPTCPDDTKSISGNSRQCLKNPRDGYSCPNGTTNDGDICYENCRSGYSSSGVATCHYTGGGTTYTKSCHTEKISCSYYKGTKVIKKCSGGGTKCDGCRDGYADDGLICRYKGAWDYARNSYTRAKKYESKNVCATPGYTYNDNKGQCECTPALTATTTVLVGNVYAPKNSVILTATASNTKACGATSIAKFEAVFKDASNNLVARCSSTDGISCSAKWDAALGNYNVKSTISTDFTNDATSTAASVVVNSIPATLSITAPANNASYLTTSGFQLKASGNIENGVIDFYRNTESRAFGVCTIGESSSTSCIYNVSASTWAAGSYSITAKSRATATVPSTVSTPVNITITAPIVPTVSITSPVSGAAYLSTDTISLAASSNTSGLMIDFYKNNEATAWNSCSILAPATSCSTTSTASIGTGGSNTVVAKIRGTNTSSAAVPFTVGATVAITSPANNASYARSSLIPLVATSNVKNGVIYFYKNNEANSFGVCTIGASSATSCTYNVSGNTLAAGSYSLTAKVGNTATVSAPVNITITP